MDHKCGDVFTSRKPLSIRRRHLKICHIGVAVTECVNATDEGQVGNRGTLMLRGEGKGEGNYLIIGYWGCVERIKCISRPILR